MFDYGEGWAEFAGPPLRSTEPPALVFLQRFGQFLSERALRSLVLVRAPVLFAAAFAPHGSIAGRRSRRCRGPPCHRRPLLARLRWLSLVGSQQAILQRRSVESADDQVHLFRVRRVDECETFGLLRFRVAYDFDIVEDEILGVQPRLDVVLGYPDG